jgi:hypothetical protein
MKRRAPPFAIFAAIVAFVFAQLMGALHACEIGLPAADAKAAAVTQAADDCCDHGQPASDPGCDNHCQQAYKAPERVQATAVAPLVATGFAIAFATAAAPPPASPRPTAPHLARHTEPPLSIRNCCFRI